jgi:hypothetical protein
MLNEDQLLRPSQQANGAAAVQATPAQCAQRTFCSSITRPQIKAHGTQSLMQSHTRTICELCDFTSVLLLVAAAAHLQRPGLP